MRETVPTSSAADLLVIRALECLRDSLAAELQVVEGRLGEARRGLGLPRPAGTLAGLPPLAAAVRVAQRLAKPFTTPEMAAELLMGGVATRAKNLCTSLYATMRNSPKFLRDGDYWVLVQE